jgi:polygalacturonase
MPPAIERRRSGFLPAAFMKPCNLLLRLLAITGFAAGGLLSMPPDAKAEALPTGGVTPALPRIPDRTFNLADFGAVADGQTLNTGAFRRAVAAVKHAGGGRLVVPKGVFRTGAFSLCSNLELRLEEGAVIQAPATFAEEGFPEPGTLKSREEAREKIKPVPLIAGKKLHDVAITGPGTIDGNGAHWWAWSERAARNAAATEPARMIYPRANLIVVDGCDRLLVADVTLTNSPKFHLVPRNINDLTIERVKIRAPWDGRAPNTDGIDPGPGRNFLIRDCDIDTGDDDIVIKAGGTNILIENCTIRHGHGISIGSETTLGVHGMLVRHCTFEETDNGIRIKSMRGAGGPVSDIRYRDITMKDVENAIVLALDYTDNNRPDFRGDSTRIPSIKDVLIERVTIEGSRHAGKIVGLPDSRITGVILRDVRIVAEKDFVIKDADQPVFERVTLDIRAGVAPPPRPGEH